MTKFFIDGDGNYLGGFDGADPPAGAKEIEAPPDNAADKWVNGAWEKAAPLPDLLRFNQLFAEAVTDGVFTDDQFLKAQRFQLVLDEDKRNGSLIELIRDGQPDQQLKLYEIATICGIPLPPIEMLTP